MTKPYPTSVYFVRKPSEYLTFIGRMIQIAAFGYTLGLDVMFVGEDLPENAPVHFHHPGLWVEYSDKSVELVGKSL